MGFLGFVGFVFVAAFVGGIILAIVNSSKRRDMAQSMSGLKDFTPDFEIMGATGDNGVAIDESRGKLCLLTRVAGRIHRRVIPHTDLLSSEIFEDGETVTKTVRSSQLGGAVVGGLLLGGVGAVIGGLSGKRVQQGKIKRVELRLTVNDAASPTHTVGLLGQEVARNSMLYKMASDTARTWQARMDVLIKRADAESAKSQQQRALPATERSGSVADEIQKLAKLKEQGALTQAEFDSEKAKVLNRAAS